MKKIKKNMVVLLMIISFILCLPVQLFAADDMGIKLENRLKLSYQDAEGPLTKAKFSLYFVAAVDEYGEMTVTDDFSGYPVQIHAESDGDWNTLASTLESYVLRDKLVPVNEGKTDDQGIISFPTGTNMLENGLYLVVGTRHTQDGYVYDAQPFLVMLPTADISSNAWIYDVIANPKYEKRKVPASPEDEKNPPGNSVPPKSNTYMPGNDTKLPQTGQMWWPVPILFAIGLTLLILGILQRRGERNEKER